MIATFWEEEHYDDDSSEEDEKEQEEHCCPFGSCMDCLGLSWTDF
jgi:hypothetical protein